MTREVCPASDQGFSVDEYLATLDPVTRAFADKIRELKASGPRPRPSARLILAGAAPSPDWRPALLDRIAALVDEDLFGRSDMCKPFAFLLAEALNLMGHKAKPLVGRAEYQRANGTWVPWEHAWVKIGRDVLVDGNVDSMGENPAPELAPSPSPAPIGDHDLSAPETVASRTVDGSNYQNSTSMPSVRSGCRISSCGCRSKGS